MEKLNKHQCLNKFAFADCIFASFNEKPRKPKKWKVSFNYCLETSPIL